MIEAMACGTPVIAFRRGSVPEVIDEGVTGFIVDDVDSAVRALERLPELSARAIRGVFDRRFTSARMAQDYLALHRREIENAASDERLHATSGTRDPGYRVARQ